MLRYKLQDILEGKLQDKSQNKLQDMLLDKDLSSCKLQSKFHFARLVFGKFQYLFLSKLNVLRQVLNMFQS